MYFIIPIAIAMIGVIIFIYNFYIIYKDIINTYIGNEVFILTIILGVILMIGIYLCYFVGTYYSFKFNIEAYILGFFLDYLAHNAHLILFPLLSETWYSFPNNICNLRKDNKELNQLVYTHPLQNK